LPCRANEAAGKELQSAAKAEREQARIKARLEEQIAARREKQAELLARHAEQEETIKADTGMLVEVRLDSVTSQ
jgi:hypothetical protein